MAKVILRASALKERKDFIQYGLQEFGQRAAREMHRQIEQCLHLLGQNPRAGVRVPELDTPDTQIRKFVIHRLLVAYYYVDEQQDELHIISFWNVRQNPAKISSRLRQE